MGRNFQLERVNDQYEPTNSAANAKSLEMEHVLASRL